MRKRFGLIAALLVSAVLCAVFVTRAYSAATVQTLTGTPASGTGAVVSLSVSSTPVVFVAGTAGLNTCISGGVFYASAACVLEFTDGSGGPIIGSIGLAATTPLTIAPANIQIGAFGQTGSGICTITKGDSIYVTTGAGGGTFSVSWTGPVNLQ